MSPQRCDAKRPSIAEIVVNTLPRTRTRHDVHHHPHYYRIRNHLVDFFVHRSRLLQEGRSEDSANEEGPRVVMPGLAGDEEAAPGPRPVLLKQAR